MLLEFQNLAESHPGHSSHKVLGKILICVRPVLLSWFFLKKMHLKISSVFLCKQISFETMQIEEKFQSGIICKDPFTGPVCVTFPSIFSFYSCVQSNSNVFEK